MGINCKWKVTGTFNKDEIVEINTTGNGGTYTITVTAIDNKGNKLAIANAKMRTISLPAIGEAVPEEGWTVEQAKGLVARDGLKAHLGEKVQYSPEEDSTGVYRIFYYDNEVNSDDATKGYFGDALNTLYLKRDYVSRDTNLSSYGNYTPLDGGATMRKMNPKWAKESNGNSIDLVNEHCVSWLCDPTIWETKYKIPGIANYVVGSPSVEMYMKAYGVYKEADGDPNRNSTALICKIGNANGYSVGADNSYTWNGSTEYNTGNNSIEAGPNNIFLTDAWWLSSPSSQAGLRIYGTNSNLGVIGSSYPQRSR